MKAFILILAISAVGCIGDRMAQCNESCNRMMQSCWGSDCKGLLETCYEQCNKAWVYVPTNRAEQDCNPPGGKP
jgi:hypothetical protein